VIWYFKYFYKGNNGHLCWKIQKSTGEENLMKPRLLFSGAGGSLFPYLFEELSNKYVVFAMDSDPIIKEIYSNYNVLIVPNISDSAFVNAVSRLIREYKIDYYIPGIDEEICIAIDLAKKENINVLAPTKEFVGLSLNKYKLMHVLSDLNISTIETVLADKFNDQFEYPVFLKPNVGRGSRGIKKINNRGMFEAYFLLEEYRKEDVLVQPYIGGEEYTISVTVNNLNNLISIVPKVVYLKQGITRHAKSLKHKNIEVVCEKIVENLIPSGSFNVQLKEWNNKLYIFEINPRFSTTLVLSIASGINEVDLNILNFNKKNVKYIEFFEEKKLMRRWTNIFYD
jgi:carbamoyl-phosphate synthase large subunit